ncbi:hypothetical protein VW040_15745 [Phaeobacter sp. JH85H1]|uniref:hypothetical protein n=1 Tax=unclassified Phaeobacter TaxID=2621772 RepID=UPI003A88BAFB
MKFRTSSIFGAAPLIYDRFGAVTDVLRQRRAAPKAMTAEGSHQDFAATRQNLGFWDTDGSTSSETPQDQSLGRSCRWPVPVHAQ